MRRDRVRPAALARRVLLPPALAGGAVICLLIVLGTATEPSAGDGGPLAQQERKQAARSIAVKLSQDLEGAPSTADVQRARIPLSERERRLRAHPYYELYKAAKSRYDVSWFLVASIHYQETGFRGGRRATTAKPRARKTRVRPRDFRKVMTIARKLHAAGAREGLGRKAVRATTKRYGSSANGGLSTAMVIERARAWRLVGVIPLPGSGELATPVKGTVGGCGYFSCPRPGHMHNGVDFLAPSGTPIHAADGGRVALLQTPSASGGYGNFICIQHRPHLSSCYAHLSVFARLKPGEGVKRGQVIGLVGSTGHSTTSHLHFEVRRGAASCQACAVDPLPLLDGQVPQASIPALLKHPRRAAAKGPTDRNTGYVPAPVQAAAPPAAAPAPAPPAPTPTAPSTSSAGGAAPPELSPEPPEPKKPAPTAPGAEPSAPSKDPSEYVSGGSSPSP